MAIALYARKSIEREGSISCDTQIEFCKSRIEPAEKNEQLLIYIDNGFSGGNLERDQFKKMMQMIENDQITKVIIYRLDRISRSLSDFVGILNTLKQHRVSLVSTQESFDTSSPYGDMIVKILMIFAEFERNSIISRVTQSYAHRSELGFYMGGRQPYGFDLTETTINNIKTKKLTPISEEIEQIKYIFESYGAENITLGKLMRNLIENSILPKNGSSWSTAKLSTILKNPIYVRADSSIYDYFSAKNTNIISPPESFDSIHGLQLYGKTKHNHFSMDWADLKLVVMTHEGVIDSEVWLKCQHKLSKNKQIGNAVSNKTSWLGGKVICEKCRRTMTTIKGYRKSGEPRIYFTCTGRSHNKICTGTASTIYAESLEKMIYDSILQKLHNIKQQKTKVQRSANPILNELRNKIKTIELEEKKLANTITSQDINADLIIILNSKASQLKSEKNNLTLKIKEIQAAATENNTIIDFQQKWLSATFEEKRSVCSVLIDKIIIEENGDIEVVWYL